MVAWLRNSLLVLLFMTETSDALNRQTKEILGETVVLGEGFEDAEAEAQAYFLSKRTGNQDDESFFDRVKNFFMPQKKLEPIEGEPFYVEELKVTPAKPIEDDAKMMIPPKVTAEEVKTPIVPKEKPSDNELLYSKLFATNYFKSIRDVESKVVDGKIATEEQRNNAVGDKGKSLGSYQIQKNFFNESMGWLKRNDMFKDLHNKSYEDIVKDPNQATKIMFGYYMKYAPNLVKNLKFEQLARLHNGGKGALMTDAGVKRTNDYANKFNKIFESYGLQ